MKVTDWKTQNRIRSLSRALWGQVALPSFVDSSCVGIKSTSWASRCRILPAVSELLALFATFFYAKTNENQDSLHESNVASLSRSSSSSSFSSFSPSAASVAELYANLKNTDKRAQIEPAVGAYRMSNLYQPESQAILCFIVPSQY